MITVTINHVTRQLMDNTQLAQLLHDLNICLDGIAIAINDEVVSKKNWNTTNLEENDNVTIIQATQGG